MELIDALVPYVGPAILLILLTGALILLRRNGVNVVSWDVLKGKIMTGGSPPPGESRESDVSRNTLERIEQIGNSVHHSDETPKYWLSPAQITTTENAQADLLSLRLSSDLLSRFISNEMMRHPLLFSTPTNSQILPIRDLIVVFSWDSELARIERVIKGSLAYPHQDMWLKCLSRYRDAIRLRFRQPGFQVAIETRSISSAIATVRYLVEATTEFNSAVSIDGGENETMATANLSAMITDAEECHLKGQSRETMVQLETIISLAHKILLRSIRPVAEGFSIDTDLYDSEVSVSRREGRSLLVVEDDYNTRELIATVIARDLPDVEIETASNGTEALQKMIQRDFTVVITDIVMPGVDGLQLLKAISDGHIDSRSIAISGASDPTIEEKAVENGADRFVGKPFDFGILSAITKELIERSYND